MRRVDTQRKAAGAPLEESRRSFYSPRGTLTVPEQHATERRDMTHLSPSTVTRLATLAALVAMFLATSSALAQPGPNDPTVQTATPPAGSRPGVLQRPTEPEPEAENGEDEGGDEGEEAEDGTQAQTPPTREGDDDGDARPTTTPAQREPARQGPPVLDVGDVAPDAGEIDSNFVEPFDPLNPPRNVMVNIDFNQADLSDVVMWISALTGRNFIIADTISASKKITIISPQPVSIAEAYRAFIAALNMNGLTVVPFGRFLKIVEAEGAQQEALEPTRSASQIPNNDQMVTHIHQLQHVDIATVEGVIDALISESGSVVPYEPTNTLIITDSGLNLLRLLDVLESLDVPSGQDRINFYQVQYASAEELSGILSEIFPPDDGGGEGAPSRRRASDNDDESQDAGETGAGVTVSQIIADTRTNQLIIITNERSFQQMLDIIGQLDVPIPGEGQIHVMFLENADATELASTLQSLTSEVESQREDGGGGAFAEADAPVNGGAVTATFSGDVSITADESTNALVVVASLRDFLALQSVVRQLDRRRQQVYVEAVIMEVSLDRNDTLGVAFNGGLLESIDGEDVPVFGATSVGGLSSLLLDPTSLNGLGVGVQGPEIPGSAEVLGIGIPSFGAILQAVQTDNNVNILSTPHILTLDNEEAEIVVGENVPFQSGTTGLGGLGGLGALSGLGAVSIQRQDVALTLRLTPQINESNYVRLEIEEQVDEVASIDQRLGPTTTTRQVRTTVVVQDQQTIVIGGLMREQESENIEKVPVLGDIPIIGNLFRHRRASTEKTNLLLLLTPYIIRSPEDFREIFRRKMDEREEFIAYFGRRSSDYVQSIDYGRKDGPMQSAYETIIEALAEEDARRRAYGDVTEEQLIDGPASGPIRVNLDDEGDAMPAPTP